MFTPGEPRSGFEKISWTNTALSAWHAKYGSFFVFVTVVMVLTKSNIGQKTKKLLENSH